MQFPSQEFYGGKLIASPSVKDISLADIIKTNEKDPILSSKPIVFIDTVGNFPEKRKKDSQSRYNPEEAKLVKDIVNKLIKAGVSPKDIGVITPYKDQEDLLKKLLKDVEVQTVDGFQGREKEVIVVSLVRSNKEKDIGFLSDLRRLNVAITRPKRKLIMVGDKETVASDKTYKKLVEYVDKNVKGLTQV